MTDPVSFEELEVGREVATHSRTITEADVANFAGVSGDFNPLHLSREVGAESAFGGRIVHGALLFSILTGLLWQTRRERPDTVAFYGVNRLRFTNPVSIGETVRVEAELLETKPREHPTASGVVRDEARLVTAADETALSCELLSLVR